MKITKIAFALATIFALSWGQNSRVAATTDYSLNIKFVTTLGGSVGASPAGGPCSADCVLQFAPGTTVTLTANSTADTRFEYWGGGGSGDVACNEGSSSSTCTFVMNSNLETRPYWTYKNIDLKIIKTGTGSGTVTGQDINCGNDCIGTYATNPFPQANGPVSLTATPSADSVFAGWSPDGQTCFKGGGKSGDTAINPDAVCSAYYSPATKTTKAIAIFNKKASASPPSSSISPPPPPAPKPEDTPPEKPVVEIKVGEKIVTSDSQPAIKDNEAITIGGRTVPNGVVTIYVFSEPKKYSTTASDDGSWTYSVSGLPEGDHHIEAEVTDPKTGKTSPRVQVIAFSVIKAGAAESSTALSGEELPHSTKLPLLPILAAGGIALAGLTAGLVVYRRHRKR